MKLITSSVWFDSIDQLCFLDGRSLRIAAVSLRKTGRWPTQNAGGTVTPEYTHL